MERCFCLRFTDGETEAREGTDIGQRQRLELELSPPSPSPTQRRRGWGWGVPSLVGSDQVCPAGGSTPPVPGDLKRERTERPNGVEKTNDLDQRFLQGWGPGSLRGWGPGAWNSRSPER